MVSVGPSDTFIAGNVRASPRRSLWIVILIAIAFVLLFLFLLI
jgi:hypothetical protein